MRKFEEDIAARKGIFMHKHAFAAYCTCHHFSYPHPADEVSGDVFDLLLSIGDFTEFKDLMLSHKRAAASSSGKAAGGSLELHGHSVA